VATPEKKYEHWPANREDGWYDLYENTHIAIAELALENADVDFYIKVKWDNTWISSIIKLLGQNGLSSDDMKNLHIVIDVDPNDLILNSVIVCGFASTVLLEAAIANKCVVMPLFDEAARAESRETIFFSDRLEIFDIAHSKDELKDIIVNRLNGYVPDNEIVKKRISSFEEYVSSCDANATDKYVNNISEVIMSQ